MLKNIRENIKNELIKTYGVRIKDGKCAFCGSELGTKFCWCPGANKINPFYKRVRKFVDNLNLWESYEDLKIDALTNRFYISGVPIKYSGLTLDDYKEIEPADTKVKKLVAAYLNDTIKNYLTGKCLILVGNPGTGKTMLMAILVESIIRNYLLTARYANCVELINEIQDTYSSKTPKSTLSVLNKYRDADFLFIDDLDKINATADSKKLIYSIINDRYDRVLPTIISANSSVDVLDEKYLRNRPYLDLLNVRSRLSLRKKIRGFRGYDGKFIIKCISGKRNRL